MNNNFAVMLLFFHLNYLRINNYNFNKLITHKMPIFNLTKMDHLFLKLKRWQTVVKMNKLFIFAHKNLQVVVLIWNIYLKRWLNFENSSNIVIELCFISIKSLNHDFINKIAQLNYLSKINWHDKVFFVC